MSKNSYDYSTRSGVLPISWQDFHSLCKALANAVSGYGPEIILPIGRGGYYPGALIAHLLQAEVYPVRLSRRVNDRVVSGTPQWLAKPPPLVAGRRVLIVDEICGSGETITMVKDEAARLMAKECKTAVLYAHTWGAGVPDYIGIVSDALILNPWDREILKDGTFQFHPEYVQALSLQGIEPESSLLIETRPIELAKG